MKEDTRCGCGKEGRYMKKDGNETIWMCNKYMRCPTYDELVSINSDLETAAWVTKIEKTLRDEFAMAVLTGYSSIPDDRRFNSNEGITVEAWREQLRKTDAEYCYQIADAMMETRK